MGGLSTDHPAPGTQHVDVLRALRRARELDLFQALDQVYAELPKAECKGCGRCCFESPGLFFIEYLRLAEWLAARPKARRAELTEAAWRELFYSWIEPERSCIFLRASRRCTIYPQRPLACRMFGLTPPDDPEQAQLELRLAAQEEAERLGRLGLEIPEATVGRALADCAQARPARGRRAKVDADAFADRVAELDARLIPRETVLQEYCFLSLPDRIGAAALGPEEVERRRLELLRRAAGGESVETLLHAMRLDEDR